jgi:hypothetical protein
MSPAAIDSQAPPSIDMDSEHFSPYRQDGKLYGFVCVVTGATKSIGKAITKELAGQLCCSIFHVPVIVACKSKNVVDADY